jgi:hypothetical protein
MKSFKSFISEEVLPTAEVQDGSIDIEKPEVRAQINNTLVAVTAQPAVTPYVVLQRIMKALAYFHIILPKKTFMGGASGIEVYEVHQFGHRMGMTNSGEFVSHIPEKFYLFIHYSTMSPIGITYAKPIVGGMYRVDARLVDADGLEKLMDMARAHGALQEASDDKATLSQRAAGREEMHTALGDCDCSQGDSPSTKKAIKVSMKKIDEAMSRKQKDMAVRRFMSHDPKAGESILKMGKKERDEKKSFASAEKEANKWQKHRLKEEEDNVTHFVPKPPKRKVKVVGGNKEEMDQQHKKLMTYHKARRKNMKEEQIDEGGMPASVIKHKQKLASMSPDELKKKFAGKSEEHLKSMARRHGYGKDSDVYSKHVKEDNLDEGMAPIKKTYAMRKMKKKVNTQVKQGLGVGKERTNTVLVTNKGDPKAAGGGGVHRIPRDKYDPTKHNLASE